MEAKRNEYRVLVGNSEGRRTLGRPTCRREDTVKMDLKRTMKGWYGLD
jgi:hypothetical protein